MDISNQITRLADAKASLASKMRAAGYSLSGTETIDALIEMLDLDKAEDEFELLSTNLTDRFITSSGKYMKNIASAFGCVFFVYGVNRGRTYRLTTTKNFLYMNYLCADVLPEYDQTGLPVVDFKSGAEIVCNSRYLMVSLTERLSTAILTTSDLAVAEI